MIRHILTLFSVNKTNADFTSWICVAVPLCISCQNIPCFVYLQQLSQCHLSLADTKNMSNQRIVMLSAVLVHWESRAFPH